MTGLLTPDTVIPYLRGRAAVGAEAGRARLLAGGISNVVLLVECGDRRLVVKQSLARLRVADDWPARRERVLDEASALELTAGISPGTAPGVVDVDPQRFAITIEAAPESWSDWKARLFAGAVDSALAGSLGAILAQWQSATWLDAEVQARYPSLEGFVQLRIDPYYRTAAERRPAFAEALTRCADRLLGRPRCFVHGDYSPKNVLVGDSRFWVVDFEVAHVGDPAFDVAFMLNHLLLKAITMPDAAGALRGAARAFWQRYRSRLDEAVELDPQDVVDQLGCLMLARVVGKSPVEYLDDAGADRAVRLATVLLTEPPDDPDRVWDLLAALDPA